MKCAMCGSEISSRFSGGFLVEGVSDKICTKCLSYKDILKDARNNSVSDCELAIEYFEECLKNPNIDKSFKVHVEKFYNDNKEDVMRRVETKKANEEIRIKTELKRSSYEGIIVTSSDKVEGKEVSEYIRMVHGEVVLGTGLLTGFTTGVSDVMGIRSDIFEDKIKNARIDATSEMINYAKHLNADAIVATRYSYSIADNDVVIVTCDGTAVKLK